MTIPKIFTVTGGQFTYVLRRVQQLVRPQVDVPEEVIATLAECTTVEQLLDFFFTTDYHVNEPFIRLFEKRLQELECTF